ncbi:hypothetical protein [Carboxylicivirga caseinilyticus]|uniref:hypothetical protein n=1 Tax=Carboxylicivirga caseinilyticus TaxID=3417572 RepID=UPI003D33DBF4|nr:hypothetical protein [Marinilabiliaceae bacterium A049]
MKKTGFIIWLMFLAAAFVGCEKWGEGMNSLEGDRPSDVGPEYGQRGNKGSTDLGTLYGDLYFILRNEDGAPIYRSGFVQPLAYINGEPYTYELNDELLQFVCVIDPEEGEIIPNLFADLLGIEHSTPADDGNIYGPMEVDFGRTSIFRAPQSVLDQAFEEALLGLSEVEESSLQVDFCGRLFGIRPDGTEKTIDSPRENMAIYQNLMMKGGYSGIIDHCLAKGYQNLYNFFSNWQYSYLKCAAGCISAANDKTGTVNVNKLEYLNGFKSIIGPTFIEDDLNNKYADYTAFNYNREDFWKDVKIGFLVWNGEYSSEPLAVFSVLDLFDFGVDMGYGEAPSFTIRSDHKWAKYENVGGFAQFADDCNQVLEYVHEDSNIVWVR